MTLSAQTWSELPPVTREAFEIELSLSHALALRDEPPQNPQPPSWREPYLSFLVAALSERAGERVRASRETIGDTEWFWVSLPAGGDRLSVGFPHSRIGPRPVYALPASLAGGALLALLAAWWLARRANRPLQRPQRAADSLGRGQTPERLPETGPREIAALSRRFDEMAKQVEEFSRRAPCCSPGSRTICARRSRGCGSGSRCCCASRAPNWRRRSTPTSRRWTG